MVYLSLKIVSVGGWRKFEQGFEAVNRREEE